MSSSLKNLVLLGILSYAIANPSSNKIGVKLQQILESKSSAPAFLNFNEKTDNLLQSISASVFDTREARINAIVQSLRVHAAANQKAIQNLLDQESIPYTSFWISNQIYIPKATLSLLTRLSEFTEIDGITEEQITHIEKPKISEIVQELPGAVRETQWGVAKIEADKVWGNQIIGFGVVVGIIDTGIRGTHQDLRINYRTPYGWRDPSFTNSTAVPSDKNGHGTHCLGIILGSNGIGVAPGSKWMACNGCNEGACSASDLILCGEWMLCPTLEDGSQEDCSKAPNLVSNSWAGGQGENFYDPVVNAWKAANIIPVFGQGNDGPNCTTALSPADSDVIGVGATDIDDALATFSSKGPSVLGTLKPDLSAPGVRIYSSFNNSDTGYATLSGTSMATPHVAGAVALILSQRPNLTYEQVKEALYSGVDTTGLVECTETCGGIPGSTYPNNCYGRGRLNVFNSMMLSGYLK